MNRITLLLATALIVSAPIVATVATDTVAAEKGKTAAKGATKDARAPGGETSGGYDFNRDPNTAFIRALASIGRGGTSTSGKGTSTSGKGTPKAGSKKGAPAAAGSAPAARSGGSAGPAE
jgi:hypothetical protein